MQGLREGALQEHVLLPELGNLVLLALHGLHQVAGAQGSRVEQLLHVAHLGLEVDLRLHGRFLDWVNGRLAHSRWIVVDMSKAKYSAALAEERPEDRPGQRVIALRGDCENAKLVTQN